MAEQSSIKTTLVLEGAEYTASGDPFYFCRGHVHKAAFASAVSEEVGEAITVDKVTFEFWELMPPRSSHDSEVMWMKVDEGTEGAFAVTVQRQ